MTKRFVIGTSLLSDDGTKEFLAFIRASNVAWWHWLPNFWLVKDSNDHLTVESIMEALKSDECLVMEIHEDITWLARGRTKPNGRDFADWLKETWPEKPEKPVKEG